MAKDRTRHVSAHAKAPCEWAKLNGWKVSRTKGDHLRLVKPGCHVVFSAATPSCPHATRKAIKQCEINEKQGATQ